MVENVQLEEELKEKQEGSKEKGWWEVDARQLLKAGEELTLEVGNLLERTGDRGKEEVAIYVILKIGSPMEASPSSLGGSKINHNQLTPLLMLLC